MKQEYRHTRPYRGKDPYFENEEMTEIDNAIYEATEQGLICIRCGGQGGSHYEEFDGGGSGYLPCYACSDTGLQSYYSWQGEISCTNV